ncbi:MAG: aminomethyltransferase family protein [Pseudomonadota bacterium]
MIEVHQGRLQTPFYARQKALDGLNQWHNWNGYTVPDALYCADHEYFAIRNATAVFDLSPMNKYRITGPDAYAFLDRLLTRDLSSLAVGRVAYAVWCDGAGQVIDDGTVFRLADEDFRLCCAGRHAAWFADSARGFDVDIVEETADIAALAVQGPTSFSVLERMGLDGLASLKPFAHREFAFGGRELLVSRTGFTGDLGYELWLEPSQAESIWDALFRAGELTGIRAIGTEALALSRIEATFLEPGVDFLHADETVRQGRSRSPFELGLDWLVDFGKPVFNGRQALARERREGSTWQLVRLDIEGNKPAPDAYVYAKPGRDNIGFVTSAAWSPVCKQNIALATVKAPHGRVGSELWVEIYYQREMHWQKKMARATVTRGPFWNPERRRVTPPLPY